MLAQHIEENELWMKNQEVSTKNIVAQICQVTSLFSGRTQVALPGDTEKNSREQANAVTLRSGKQYEELQQKVTQIEADKEKEINEEELRERERVRGAKSKRVQINLIVFSFQTY